MHIKGIAAYSSLEGGSWTIVSSNEVYYPVNLPVQYQSEGCKVSITATLLNDVSSIFMNGKVIRIISFETL